VQGDSSAARRGQHWGYNMLGFAAEEMLREERKRNVLPRLALHSITDEPVPPIL
jgi:hypothetical protein